MNQANFLPLVVLQVRLTKSSLFLILINILGIFKKEFNHFIYVVFSDNKKQSWRIQCFLILTRYLKMT